MDLENFGSVLFGLLAAAGIFFALRSRRKSGPQKVTEFYEHLRGIGIDAVVLEENAEQSKISKKSSWGQKPMGTIKLRDKNVDSVNIIGMASQYGVNYFLDYLVNVSSFIGRSQKRKKTRMSAKKLGVYQGKLLEIAWKGDELLSRRLDYDYQLKDKLSQIDEKMLKGGITILPELKHEMARIRTNYHLPTAELFESIDAIAGHVRSEW